MTLTRDDIERRVRRTLRHRAATVTAAPPAFVGDTAAPDPGRPRRARAVVGLAVGVIVVLVVVPAVVALRSDTDRGGRRTAVTSASPPWRPSLRRWG